jgi:hypothetical protein
MCHTGSHGFLTRFLLACIASGVVLRAQSPVLADPGRPLSLGVVIDVRPQQREVIAFERQVADAMGSMLAGENTKGFVVSYSDRVQVVEDWSPTAGLKDAALRLTVDGSEDGRRGAALNDALLNGLARLGSVGHEGRKVLVVIGEGNDGDSSTTFGDVLSAAKAGHVQCFALLVANHRSQVGRVRQFGFDLYRLASATHGKAYDVRTDPGLLDAALRDLLARLATNY